MSKDKTRESGNGSAPDRVTIHVTGPTKVTRALIATLERDGFDAPKLARGVSKPDVIVVAVDSPTTGASAIRDARRERPAGRFVVVAGRASPAEARQLLVDDVLGLVLQSEVPTSLAPTVRAVLAGQVSYPAEVMPTTLRIALSSREKQILGMVVMGFGNAEIAAKLHLSQSTVKTHLSSAFATMGVGSRKEAVALILDPDAGFGTGILSITGSEGLGGSGG